MASSIHSDANQLVQVTAPATVMTTTTNSDQQSNLIKSRARFLINVSAVSGTSPSLTINIQAYNPAANTWKTVASTAAITAAGDYTFLLGFGVPSSVGAMDPAPLPITWRLNYDITGTTPSFTFGGVVAECYY
ncbi:MAG: hypothetical protein KGL63_06595 [Betaproteobacteria bacterium]|nr:hypothetical protein [Betaproteobacteria bacterium]